MDNHLFVVDFMVFLTGPCHPRNHVSSRECKPHVHFFKCVLLRRCLQKASPCSTLEKAAPLCWVPGTLLRVHHERTSATALPGPHEGHVRRDVERGGSARHPNLIAREGGMEGGTGSGRHLPSGREKVIGRSILNILESSNTRINYSIHFWRTSAITHWVREH